MIFFGDLTYPKDEVVDRLNLRPKLKLVLLMTLHEDSSLRTLVLSMSSYLKNKYFLSNWYFLLDLRAIKV
jgi:hypothetical protein